MESIVKKIRVIIGITLIIALFGCNSLDTEPKKEKSNVIQTTKAIIINDGNGVEKTTEVEITTAGNEATIEENPVNQQSIRPETNFYRLFKARLVEDGVVRTLHPIEGNYFLTTNYKERNNAIAKLNYEYKEIVGSIYKTKEPNTVPLYRMFSGKNHFYTTNYNERMNAINQLKFKDEGIAGFVYVKKVSGTIPLYRLHRKGVGHLYTTKASERDLAVSKYGYKYEGIACYIKSITFYNPIFMKLYGKLKRKWSVLCTVYSATTISKGTIVPYQIRASVNAVDGQGYTMAFNSKTASNVRTVKTSVEEDEFPIAPQRKSIGIHEIWYKGGKGYLKIETTLH